MPTDFEPLLTEDDVARILNVHPGTLRNWRCKGRGPRHIMIGAAVRYRPQDLRDYVEGRTRQPRNAQPVRTRKRNAEASLSATEAA